MHALPLKREIPLKRPHSTFRLTQRQGKRLDTELRNKNSEGIAWNSQASRQRLWQASIEQAGRQAGSLTAGTRVDRQTSTHAYTIMLNCQTKQNSIITFVFCLLKVIRFKLMSVTLMFPCLQQLSHIYYSERNLNQSQGQSRYLPPRDTLNSVFSFSGSQKQVHSNIPNSGIFLVNSPVSLSIGFI